MKNKVILTLLGISLLVALVGIVLKLLGTAEQTAQIYIDAGLSFANFIGLILLLYNGTIFKTIYFIIILFFLCIAIVGVVFKIMHWPWANILVLASILGMLVTYAIRFFKKQEKRRFDVLKLLWITTLLVGTLCVILKWLPKEITYVSNFILWLTIADFVVTLSWKNTPSRY